MSTEDEARPSGSEPSAAVQEPNLWRLTDLPVSARNIVATLRRNGFDAASGQNRQVLGLAEEVGEFVGAYRRWSGQARRSGTAEEMYAELADVVITAFVAAEEFGVDLEDLIGQKLVKVFSRGWRELAASGKGDAV
jgi:NTP pyrophosphatase (non-canonical NTP hydrolase)